MIVKQKDHGSGVPSAARHSCMLMETRRYARSKVVAHRVLMETP